jgi:protein-tyrosine phosphatase
MTIPAERGGAEVPAAQPPGRAGTEILVLCTANVCRSPIAAAMLASALAGRAGRVSVRSAGMLAAGAPPDPLAVSAAARLGLDIAAHRSRLAGPAELAAADLTLAMTRAHLRHAVVTAPECWPRAFTIKELARRAGQVGPRPPGTSLAQWLALAGAGRRRGALLGDCSEDDVADPAGGPPRAYAQTAELLGQLVARLAVLGWP